MTAMQPVITLSSSESVTHKDELLTFLKISDSPNFLCVLPDIFFHAFLQCKYWLLYVFSQILHHFLNGELHTFFPSQDPHI